jgi:hypothetical protein
MAKLPFIVEPRIQPVKELIGTEESGKIEIERKGYLTAGEKAFAQQGLGDDQLSTQVMSLSRRVARKFSVELQEAFECVSALVTTGGSSKLSDKVEKEFEAELAQVVETLIANAQKKEIIQASCMALYRIGNGITIDDIVDLHPDLRAALAALYRDEEERSVDRILELHKEASQAETDADVIEKK